MTAHYFKIADSVVDAGLGPYAGWLYTVIVRHINRKTNELRKTVKELADLAGMSTKSVMRYTKVLEAQNVLQVHRSQSSEIANVNIYSLAGEAAAVSLFNGVPVSPTTNPAKSPGAVPQSPRKDSNTEMNTPNESVCVFDWVLNEIQSFHGISADWLIRDFGAAHVLAVVRYAKASNLGIGWVITELRENRLALHPADISQPQAEWSNPIPEVPDDDDGQDRPYETSSSDDSTVDDYDATPSPDDTPIIDIPDLMDEEPNVKTWQVVMGQFEGQFDRQTFDAVISGTRYVGEEGGEWVCLAKNLFARDMLQHRLYRDIRRIVRDVHGKGVELRFVVAAKAGAS